MGNWETFLEYFGVITGLIYLFLEIKQHRAMWVLGFMTSLLYVFIFFFSKFYADMSLNIYYVVISIYGFFGWKQGIEKEQKGTHEISYCHLKLPLAVVLLGVSLLLFWLGYYILSRWTDSPIAVGDAFTTALSIVATWMLARRILEQWWIWVVVNLVSAWLYYTRELYPTCFLFICYGVLAVLGWLNWKKKGVAYEKI